MFSSVLRPINAVQTVTLFSNNVFNLLNDFLNVFSLYCSDYSVVSFLLSMLF